MMLYGPAKNGRSRCGTRVNTSFYRDTATSYATHTSRGQPTEQQAVCIFSSPVQTQAGSIGRQGRRNNCCSGPFVTARGVCRGYLYLERTQKYIRIERVGSLSPQRPNRSGTQQGREGLTFEEPRDDDVREHVRVLDDERLPLGRPACEIRFVSVASADHFKRFAQKHGLLALDVFRSPARLSPHGVLAACGHRPRGRELSLLSRAARFVYFFVGGARSSPLLFW